MNDLNHTAFFIFLYSKTCIKPSVWSTFVMLSSVSDDVKGDGCRKSFTRVRGVDKYKGEGVFRVHKGGNYKVEE